MPTAARTRRLAAVPDAPVSEAEATDRAAAAALDQVTAPPPDEPAAEPVKAPMRRVTRKGPANLGEPVLELPVTMRLVSIGKPASNVSATLGFDLDRPFEHELKDLMGEHAYAARFRGDYIGNGLQIRKAPLSTDPDNRVIQKMNVLLPRSDQGVDQVASYIVPLLVETPDALAALLALDPTWRLNVNVDLAGSLVLYEMQGSLDLTSKAPDDLTGDEGTAQS